MALYLIELELEIKLELLQAHPRGAKEIAVGRSWKKVLDFPTPDIDIEPKWSCTRKPGGRGCFARDYNLEGGSAQSKAGFESMFLGGREWPALCPIFDHLETTKDEPAWPF